MHARTHDDLDTLGRVIRTGLGVPKDWVDVVDLPGTGHTCQIALNMYAFETGNAESGPSVSIYPTRYAYVYVDEVGYVIDLFDAPLDDDDAWDPFESHPARTVRLGARWEDACVAVLALICEDNDFRLQREVMPG